MPEHDPMVVSGVAHRLAAALRPAGPVRPRRCSVRDRISAAAKPTDMESRADAQIDEIGDLGAVKNGVVRGFAGPVAAIRRQFATSGSTVSRQALTRPSTHSANMV
ncbi:hypothetical protein GCM10010193_57970 [Kitasatospora atroaurantiaca]